MLFNATEDLEIFGNEVEILAWGGTAPRHVNQILMDCAKNFNQLAGPASDDAMAED